MDALLIVDFQNDFVPGGALPVAGGAEIAEPLNRLLDRFDLVLATRDWPESLFGFTRLSSMMRSRWMTVVTVVAATAGMLAATDVQTLGPQVGSRVPDFRLTDQNGQTHTLASSMGPKGAMIVFFRSADW